MPHHNLLNAKTSWLHFDVFPYFFSFYYFRATSNIQLNLPANVFYSIETMHKYATINIYTYIIAFRVGVKYKCSLVSDPIYFTVQHQIIKRKSELISFFPIQHNSYFLTEYIPPKRDVTPPPPTRPVVPDKGPGSQSSPPTTRHPVAQAPTTNKGGYNMIYIIKDFKF